MRTMWTSVAAVVMVGLFAGCDSDPTAPRVPGGDTEWRGELAPGQTIEIRGINGGMVATPVAGTEALITAEFTGIGDDPALVSVDFVEHDGGVTACAIYPNVGGEPPNDCQPNGGGFVGGDLDVIVHFTVSVPTGVQFDGVTVNGNISATSLDADASAVTVNGGISISSTALVEATTVNGNVAAQIGTLTPDRPLSFVAVNGNVALVLPAAVNADVLATTVNGIMTTDFSLTEPSEGQWEGVLGAGGSLLSLATVNGNLQLLEAP